MIAFPVTVLSMFGLTACSAPADPPVQVHVQLAADAGVMQVADALAGVTVLHNRMGVAQAASLPAGLNVAPDPDSTVGYRAGDVVYHPATHEIVVFTSSRYRASDRGAVRLGRITEGLRGLAECGPTCPVQLTVSGG